ncbi:hypothetical protein ACFYXH_40985 [Streptomyces sp. NPDC002730]|uniref:hypothetical protein n=1 Tax=Streptomyces sp. NPDC002730 TaxID=3364662 RepID=UPI0036AB7C48
MRVAPPCQLSLGLGDVPTPQGRWQDLPEAARAQALVLLARLIARGALTDADDGSGAGDER